MNPKSWFNTYSIFDKHSNGGVVYVFHSSLRANTSTIWLFNVRHISHYILICDTHLVFVITRGLIPELLLAAFKLQISHLATDHDISISLVWSCVLCNNPHGCSTVRIHVLVLSKDSSRLIDCCCGPNSFGTFLPTK